MEKSTDREESSNRGGHTDTGQKGTQVLTREDSEGESALKEKKHVFHEISSWHRLFWKKEVGRKNIQSERRSQVATYIILFRFTQKGIQEVKNSPRRIQEVKRSLKDLGAKVKEFYSVMGRYDSLFIVEAPNDETIAKGNLFLGSLGNVRTETLRAFTEEEYDKIVKDLP